MKDADLDEMIAEADSDNDGLINYEGKFIIFQNNPDLVGSFTRLFFFRFRTSFVQ